MHEIIAFSTKINLYITPIFLLINKSIVKYFLIFAFLVCYSPNFFKTVLANLGFSTFGHASKQRMDSMGSNSFHFIQSSITFAVTLFWSVYLNFLTLSIMQIVLCIVTELVIWIIYQPYWLRSYFFSFVWSYRGTWFYEKMRGTLA